MKKLAPGSEILELQLTRTMKHVEVKIKHSMESTPLGTRIVTHGFVFFALVWDFVRPYLYLREEKTEKSEKDIELSLCKA